MDKISFIFLMIPITLLLGISYLCSFFMWLSRDEEKSLKLAPELNSIAPKERGSLWKRKVALALIGWPQSFILLISMLTLNSLTFASRSEFTGEALILSLGLGLTLSWYLRLSVIRKARTLLAKEKLRSE